LIGCPGLNTADWDRLKVELASRKVRVVALDLPTSWAMATGMVDDFTARMFDAINGMMLDMLAAVARKDYEDRRRRQMQGQAKAKAEGKYVGRTENKCRNARIAAMLAAGTSYSDIQGAIICRVVSAYAARTVNLLHGFRLGDWWQFRFKG
jgi:DNA invertase Pin-like site-specific DNA recombinase